MFKPLRIGIATVGGLVIGIVRMPMAWFDDKEKSNIDSVNANDGFIKSTFKAIGRGIKRVVMSPTDSAKEFYNHEKNKRGNEKYGKEFAGEVLPPQLSAMEKTSASLKGAAVFIPGIIAGVFYGLAKGLIDIISPESQPSQKESFPLALAKGLLRIVRSPFLALEEWLKFPFRETVDMAQAKAIKTARAKLLQPVGASTGAIGNSLSGYIPTSLPTDNNINISSNNHRYSNDTGTRAANLHNFYLTNTSDANSTSSTVTSATNPDISVTASMTHKK